VSVIEEERAMEASSTDKRIDDLAGRVGRFEGRFERFEDKVDGRFDKVDGRFDKVDAQFDKLQSKVDMTNRTIWGGIFAAAMIKILFG
jgi:hypothetical protein